MRASIAEQCRAGISPSPPALTHLQQFEAEAIHIMREAVAESDNPVMLYSIGKDSSVLLHLALKAFHPAKPRFPVLHFDTGWKFAEMIAFRDRRAREFGLDLIVHTNADGLETVDVSRPAEMASFRLPVQCVNRPDADFRGACGMVTGGQVRPGMEVTVLPSGHRTEVARIVTYDGDLAVAGPGQSVTVTLRDEVDVSRGDVIAAADSTPKVTDRLKARVVWMSEAALVAGAS